MTQIILPVRVQRSRQHKTVSPNGLPVKSVCRPGKYGNPFAVIDVTGGYSIKATDKAKSSLCNQLVFWVGGFYPIKEDAVDGALKCFEAYLNEMIAADPAFLEPLKGCNLSCFCKLTDKCHADTLIKRSNADLILAEYNQQILF